MFRPGTRGTVWRRALAAVVLATPLGGASFSAAAADTALVLVPDADALVKSGAPNANFGTSAALQADRSPETESYLRFTVPVAGAPVARARLQLFAVDGSQNGPALYPSVPS